MSAIERKFRQQFFHGTRADLARGDLLVPGYASNFGEGKSLSWSTARARSMPLFGALN